MHCPRCNQAPVLVSEPAISKNVEPDGDKWESRQVQVVLSCDCGTWSLTGSLISEVTEPHCWCGARANFVNEATDATASHPSCEQHLKDGYRAL